jgi:tyrosyl-tRNA synthetase
LSEEIGKQLEVLADGTVDLISAEELEKKLILCREEKRPLRVKYGADPSAPDLHLGHTVPLRKLRQFQEFGHQVVFIIGDFTARIGDPTHRNETRPMLSKEQVERNALSYQDQVFQILERSKTEVRYNSEWLDRMSPADFLHLTAQYTVARLIERDDFKKRFEGGHPIAVVEFLYPLLQGYDSVVVRSDIELGGTDQKFNLLVGRELQKVWNQRPQSVMTLPLLEGTDGVQKMSKSYQNYIALKDTPREMFGKIMSVPDALMERYYRYTAGLSRAEVTEIAEQVKAGKKHPRDAKADLGERLVSFYHSPEAAREARLEFDQIFKDKGLPDEIEEILLEAASADIVTILKEAGLVPSKGEARRLVVQGGVKVNLAKISDPAMVVDLNSEVLIQCGKRKFAKVRCRGR